MLLSKNTKYYLVMCNVRYIWNTGFWLCIYLCASHKSYYERPVHQGAMQARYHSAISQILSLTQLHPLQHRLVHGCTYFCHLLSSSVSPGPRRNTNVYNQHLLLRCTCVVMLRMQYPVRVHFFYFRTFNTACRPT